MYHTPKYKSFQLFSLNGCSCKSGKSRQNLIFQALFNSFRHIFDTQGKFIHIAWREQYDRSNSQSSMGKSGRSNAELSSMTLVVGDFPCCLLPICIVQVMSFDAKIIFPPTHSNFGS